LNEIRVLFTREILLLYGVARNTVRCKSSGREVQGLSVSVREMQGLSVSVIHKTTTETEAQCIF